MFQLLGGRFGRLILGDTPLSPMQDISREQAASNTSVGLGEGLTSQPVDGLRCKYPPPVYDGVPVAKRPPHQQIRCMTCNQTLEDEHQMVKCHVCSALMHDTCVEVLRIGHTWKAHMCLNCQ